jgi:hypothetical protein
LFFPAIQLAGGMPCKQLRRYPPATRGETDRALIAQLFIVKVFTNNTAVQSKVNVFSSNARCSPWNDTISGKKSDTSSRLSAKKPSICLQKAADTVIPDGSMQL